MLTTAHICFILEITKLYELSGKKEGTFDKCLFNKNLTEVLFSYIYHKRKDKSINEEMDSRKDYTCMKKANYHVSGNCSSGYSVRREGTSRASAHVTTKAYAERLAKQFSHNLGGGEVRIHGPNGRIIDSDTVPNGRDSCPPRDMVM